MRSLVSMCLVLLPFYSLHAQGVRNVELKNSRVAYAPAAFYIANVIDDRADKDAIGKVYSAQGRGEDMVIPGGAASALSRYIAANVRQNKALQQVAMHVQKLDFDVKKKDGLWQLKCTVALAFYNEDRLLVAYTGDAHGEFNSDPAAYAENFIRQTFETDIKRFDNWWGVNHDRVATSPNVIVNFVIARTIGDAECIPYTADRPLKIGDFQGPEQHIRDELAATYSGNKYAYRVTTEKGHLVVYYTITPYFNKSKSWFKNSENNAYILAHEQLHFDITALKTCEIITKMRNTVFTQANYKTMLDNLPDQVGTATGEMQEQYDGETNHGIIRDKQSAWEAKIKILIREAACY